MINAPISPAIEPVLRRIAAAAADRDSARGSGLQAETGWLHEAGLLVGALPGQLARRSGWSDDPLAVADLLRRIGSASLPLGRLFEGHVNAAQLIAISGSPAVRARVQAEVACGGMLGVWGADAGDPVIASPTPSGYVLTGTKAFCSGLGLVGTALIPARSGDRIVLLAIDVTDPARADPSTWDVSGMRATTSGDFCCDGLDVAADAQVGAPDSYYAEPYFLGGMYRICAVQAGGLEALLSAFIATLRRRNRSRTALAEYRVGLVACQVAMAQSVLADIAGRVARCGPGAGNAEDVACRAILAREALECCVMTALGLIERGAGTESHREPSHLSRIRRDLGFYIRQPAIDDRLMMVGARLLAGDGFCLEAAAEYAESDR